MAADPSPLTTLEAATPIKPQVQRRLAGKHILIIAYSHYIFDARVKRHAEALAQCGHAVDVICLADGHETQRWVNLEGIFLPRYRGNSRAEYIRQYIRFFTKATYAAAKLNRRRRYDVVIVCSIPDAAIVSGLIPKLTGSKLILDMHDTMPELYREKFPGLFGAIGAAMLRVEERVSAGLADLVFAVHEPHARRLRESGIPGDKIVVILNAPDPRLFPRLGNLQKHEPGVFTVVTHGTINRRLGLDTAIEAIHLIKNQIPTLKFRIIGPGEHRENIREYARRFALEDIVQFEDGVPLEALADALQGATVGLVPNEATAATELMLPVKLLEYVSLGIPVIAARLRTIRHYFPEDAIGYFRPADAQDLARTLTHLYRHGGERHRLSLRATEVSKRISWEIQRQILCRTVDQFPTRPAVPADAEQNRPPK